MTLVRSDSSDLEPEWPQFSSSGTAWPDWIGDLINVFSTIRPLENLENTHSHAIQCARRLAAWVLDHRGRFGPNDRFQIIIGWHKSVAPFGRQLIKVGGTYCELEQLSDGSTSIHIMGDWSASVFDR